MMTEAWEILFKKFVKVLLESVYNKFKNDPKCIESDYKNYEVE